MTAILIIACVLSLIVSASLWRRQVALRRDAYIRAFSFPHGLFEKLRKQHPDLTLKECQLVAHGLRQFFLAHLKSRREYVSMPSQIADDLWHEFILYTKNYQLFCQKAFGRFFHHTPAAVLSGGSRQSNVGLRRCWWHVCREENINPRAPTRLPLLFALDGKLNIPNGFRYVADCNAVQREGGGTAIHCGGDFSSPAFDGGTGGFGDADAGHAGGDGGDGSGDGGDGGGCGGGCGGGD